MSLFNAVRFSAKLTLTATMFFVLAAAARQSFAQDITPGSSVIESKTKKSVNKAKPTTKTAPSASVKTTPKTGSSAARPKINSQPENKSAKSPPKTRPKNKAAPNQNAPAQNTPSQTVKILDLAIISAPIPVYPGEAKAAGASGAVQVEVVVDETGNVVEAQAKAGHELLRAPAEQAARASKFIPRTVSGKAVPTRGIMVYCFGKDCN